MSDMTWAEAVERAAEALLEVVNVDTPRARTLAVRHVLRAVFACPTCKGDGEVEPPADEVRAGLKQVTCPKCGGSGLRREWVCVNDGNGCVCQPGRINSLFVQHAACGWRTPGIRLTR